MQGRDITSYLERHLKQESDLEIESLADFNVIEQIKREHCYCGQAKPKPTSGSYEMPDGTAVDVDGDEDFPAQVPHKFFFDPLKLDWDDTSMEFPVHDRLHSAVMGAFPTWLASAHSPRSHARARCQDEPDRREAADVGELRHRRRQHHVQRFRRDAV